MARVTSDTAYLAVSGLKAEFMVSYNRQSPNSVVPRIASMVNTDLPTQHYPWLSSNPTMERFTGEVVHRFLKNTDWELSDEIYRATLDIKRKDLEDDKLGAYRIRVQELAGEAVRHKEELVVQTLAIGGTTLCADGQYLIDTDHPESGTNQSNKVTSAMSEATVQAGIIAMQQFTDDRGKIMGINPDVLLFGPKLQFEATRILESEIVIASALGSTSSAAVQGNRNPLKGMLTPVMSPHLTGTYDDYWFLLDTTRPMKAVILQARSDIPVEFEIPKGDDWYEREIMSCYVRGRYCAGNGLWQTVYGGIL